MNKTATKERQEKIDDYDTIKEIFPHFLPFSYSPTKALAKRKRTKVISSLCVLKTSSELLKKLLLREKKLK